WPNPRNRRGAKGRGLTYQRKVGSELTRCFGQAVLPGRWIHFVDRRGAGYAQPDFLLETPGAVICFEAKLTQCEAGRLQIQQLYRPLLRQLYSCPVVGVLVCKNLTCDTGASSVADPRDLLKETEERVWCWHFLG